LLDPVPSPVNKVKLSVWEAVMEDSYPDKTIRAGSTLPPITLPGTRVLGTILARSLPVQVWVRLVWLLEGIKVEGIKAIRVAATPAVILAIRVTNRVVTAAAGKDTMALFRTMPIVVVSRSRAFKSQELIFD